MKLYKSNDVVLESATYICLGCGEIVALVKDQKFPVCPNCGAGSSAGPAGYTDEIEFWRKLND